MLPKETLAAAFPKSVSAGRVTVPPMTLAHALALEEFGIETTGKLSTRQSVVAVHILRLPAEALQAAIENKAKTESDAVAFAAGLRPAEFIDLARALYATIANAYATAVPGQQEEGAENPPVGHPATDGLSSSPTA